MRRSGAGQAIPGEHVKLPGTGQFSEEAAGDKTDNAASRAVLPRF